MGREGADEVIHIVLQEDALAEADLRRAGFEQVLQIDGDQPGTVGIVGYQRRDDADAKAQLHVALDHPRIHHRHVVARREARGLKRVVLHLTTGCATLVAEDGILAELLQGRLLHPGQRMILRHHQGEGPEVGRQGDELLVEANLVSHDGKIRIPLADLLLAGRHHGMEVERDFGVLLGEIGDRFWQQIAGDGVGGVNIEGAHGRIQILAGDRLDLALYVEHRLGTLDDLLPDRGDAVQVLATALEDPHAQLALQQADLLADPGLAGIERIRRHRDIEVMVPDRDQVLQLL